MNEGQFEERSVRIQGGYEVETSPIHNSTVYSLVDDTIELNEEVLQWVMSCWMDLDRVGGARPFVLVIFDFFTCVTRKSVCVSLVFDSPSGP